MLRIYLVELAAKLETGSRLPTQPETTYCCFYILLYMFFIVLLCAYIVFSPKYDLIAGSSYSDICQDMMEAKARASEKRAE